VNDQLDVRAVLGEHALDPLAIPYVDLAMRVIREGRFEVAAAPFGRGIIAEEMLAHIVVDADDPEPSRGEKAGSLRADQAGRAGNNADLQEIFQMVRLARLSPALGSPGRD
jgi:hypothetical protein